jgi:hypothetical protein
MMCVESSGIITYNTPSGVIECVFVERAAQAL